MKLFNPVKVRPANPYMWYSPPFVESRPRVFRLAGTRIAYYPEDMAVYDIGDEQAPVRRVMVQAPPRLRSPRDICSLVIVPTHECNLACAYCYHLEDGRHMAGGRLPRDLITERSICRAVDLLSEHSPRVSFFGGEPLLAWGRLKWAVERVSERAHTPPRFHVTTNGTLLTDARCDYLLEHGFSMIVSLDGPAGIHNRARRTVSGEGSYRAVMAGLECVRRRPQLAQRTMLRGTYGPGESSLPQRLEHLNTLCELGYAHGVSVEPATSCKSCVRLSGFGKGELVKVMLTGARWAIGRARAGKSARWFHLWKPLTRIAKRQFSWTECGAARAYVAVMPDGSVEACHHEGCEIGDVIGGLRDEAREPWLDNRMSGRAKCRACWLRFTCGGGCRIESYKLGLGVGPGPLSCAASKARMVTALTVIAELRDEPEVLARILRPTDAKIAPEPPIQHDPVEIGENSL